MPVLRPGAAHGSLPRQFGAGESAAHGSLPRQFGAGESAAHGNCQFDEVQALVRKRLRNSRMATSLIRGKYVICKISSRAAADVIEDGAVVQRDGTILAVGSYAALAQHYQPDETSRFRRTCGHAWPGQ